MTRQRARQAFIVGALWVLLAVGSASAARAQGAAPSEGGFQPNRDYLGLLPFESIDTASNNVILTFTDLVLPGNAGRELRFERVFINQSGPLSDPTGPAWRFGIAGVPMLVVERPRPTSQNPIYPPGDMSAERVTTPYFRMLDGSSVETTYVQEPDPGVSSSLVTVQTASFWRYNRDLLTLYLPDGTVAVYELQIPTFTSRLKTITDPFGNTVTITQRSGGFDVVQSLGNGQTRTVAFEVNATTGLPETMTYQDPLGDKVWTYHYPNIPGQLESVDLPLGPGWAYDYSTEMFETGKMNRITTPQGGEVEYDYGDQTFYAPAEPNFTAVFNVLSVRRIFEGAILQGEWTFTHPYGSGQTFDSTVVTLPSGTTVEYHYGPSSLNTLAGTWLLTYRFVKNNGITLEEETRDYALQPAARAGVPWGVPRLTLRTTTRAGQAYTTQYDYTDQGANYLAGCAVWDLNHFKNYHRPTKVTERGPGGTVERITDLTYTHIGGPGCKYVVGLPKSESTTISGMVAAKAWDYDNTGFRKEETRYGIHTTFARDALGNMVAATKNNKTTSFTYDWGVRSVTSTPGVIVSRMINANGTVASETVANRTTTYTYDALLRVTSVDPPGANTNAITTEYIEPSGRVVKTSRGTSFVTTTTDGFGRPITTENSAGVRTHTAYDAQGRKLYQSLPFQGAFDSAADMAVRTHFIYDGLGRVTVETNPDQTTRTRTYDDASNTVTVEDEAERATVFGYHAFGHPDDARLVSVIDANSQTWTYTYDAIGNLFQVETPSGETRTWSHNTSGLLTQEAQPESGAVNYTLHDPSGNLLQKTDANGKVFTYTYDDNDRVTRITAGTRVTDITYETGSDNRLSIDNGDVATTFGYDAETGRIVQRQDVVGSSVFTSTYTYNNNDELTTITYPSGRIVGYDWLSEGRISRVFEDAVARDYAIGMAYHPSGGLAGYTAGNQFLTTIGYDPQRYWVTGIQSSRLGATVLGLTYGYDPERVGNVQTIADSRGSTETFTYDWLHRLASVNGPYGGVDYAYDAHGNRTTAPGGLPYVYEAGKLRLASFNGIPYGYDNNGNMTADGGSTFTYTVDNMLASATVIGGTTMYGYDGDQWRVKRATPVDTTYTLRGLRGELLTEWRVPVTGDSTFRDYIYAGTRLLSAVEKTTVPPTNNDTYGTIIPNGPSVVATVNTAGKRVLLQFAGIAGHRYRAAAWTTSGQFGCDNWLEIRTGTGDLLVANASAGSSCGSLLLDAVILPSSGTYYVVIDPLDANTGVASVRLYDIYAVITPSGPTVTVPVNTGGPFLLVEFAGTQGQQYSLVSDILAGAGGCGYASTLRTAQWVQVATALASTGCTWVMSVTEASALSATAIHFWVLAPVATSQWNSATASLYQFVDAATTIPTDGTPVVAALTTPGQRALLPFSGTAGQRIAARVSVTSGNLGCSWWLEILRPDNTYFSNYVGVCNGTYAFHEPVTLATTGTYRVLVDPKYTSTGTASMTAYVVPADVTGTLTINGAAVPVTLTGVGQQARITFPGTAGQSVTVRLTGNTIGQTTVKLLRPNGTWQTYATSSNGSFNLPAATLASNGTYTVLVDPFDLQNGNISVQVTSP